MELEEASFPDIIKQNYAEFANEDGTKRDGDESAYLSVFYRLCCVV